MKNNIYFTHRDRLKNGPYSLRLRETRPAIRGNQDAGIMLPRDHFLPIPVYILIVEIQLRLAPPSISNSNMNHGWPLLQKMSGVGN